MDWYLLKGYVAHEVAKHFDTQINDLIKSIGTHSLEICESFGIPKHVVYAPIYTGYKEYYSGEKTGGEHYNYKPKF